MCTHHSVSVWCAVFCFFLFLFMPFTAGHFRSGDEETNYRVIVAIAEDHTLFIPPSEGHIEYYGYTRPDTRLASQYGTLQPLTSIPFYLIGRGMASLLQTDARWTARFLVALTNIFWLSTFATVVCWYIFWECQVALVRSMLYTMLGTTALPLFYFSTTYFNVVPAGASVAAGALLLTCSRSRNSTYWIAGTLFLSAAILFRPETLVLAVAVCLSTFKADSTSPRRISAIGIVLALALFFVETRYKTGSFLQSSYGFALSNPVPADILPVDVGHFTQKVHTFERSMGSGLYDYFIGPQSIFFASPAALLSLYALARPGAMKSPIYYWAAGIVALQLVYCKWIIESADRLPVVWEGLGLVALLCWLTSQCRSSTAGKRMVVAVLLCSAIQQVLCVLNGEYIFLNSLRWPCHFDLWFINAFNYSLKLGLISSATVVCTVSLAALILHRLRGHAFPHGSPD